MHYPEAACLAVLHSNTQVSLAADSAGCENVSALAVLMKGQLLTKVIQILRIHTEVAFHI